MPMYDFRCLECGREWEEFTPLDGEGEQCCDQASEKFWNGSAPGVIDDSIIGGMTLENMGHEPVTVYSHSEHKRLLKERGLINRVQHTSIPGTDKAPFTTRWTSGSASFLDNARELLEHSSPTKGASSESDDAGITISTRTRSKGERLPPRWDSEYRGGPGHVEYNG